MKTNQQVSPSDLKIGAAHGGIQVKQFAKKTALRVMTSALPALSRRRFKYCLYKVDRLGDFILALGAIRQLLRHLGSSECVLVVSDLVAELAHLEFPEVQVVAVPYGAHLKDLARAWWRASAALRGIDCEMLICLRHHEETCRNLHLQWIDARCNVGVHCPRQYCRHPALVEFKFDRRIEYVFPAGIALSHEFLMHKALVGAVLGSEPTDAEIIPNLTRWVHPGEDFILVSPFASEGIRNYPLGHLSDALRLLLKRRRLPMALVGTAQDRPRLETLQRSITSRVDCTIGLPHTPTLESLFTLIGRARVVVSMETGVAHAAIAMNQSSVVLLGGGHYHQFSPWASSSKQRWITNHLDCFGCNWECTLNEPLCITGITPAALALAIESALEAEVTSAA